MSDLTMTLMCELCLEFNVSRPINPEINQEMGRLIGEYTSHLLRAHWDHLQTLHKIYVEGE